MFQTTLPYMTVQNGITETVSISVKATFFNAEIPNAPVRMLTQTTLIIKTNINIAFIKKEVEPLKSLFRVFQPDCLAISNQIFE